MEAKQDQSKVNMLLNTNLGCTKDFCVSRLLVAKVNVYVYTMCLIKVIKTCIIIYFIVVLLLLLKVYIPHLNMNIALP